MVEFKKSFGEHTPDISVEEAEGFATIAWGFPETSHITFDPILAEAFVKVIDIIVNGGFNTVESYTQYMEATQDFHKE